MAWLGRQARHGTAGNSYSTRKELTMNNFKEGDLVRLAGWIKNPAMIVDKIDDDGLATCLWFSKDRELQRATFLSRDLYYTH